MRSKSRPILAIVLSVCILATCIFVIAVSKYFPYDYDEDRLTFDKRLWTNPKDKDENERHYMIEDIMKNQLRNGMDSTDVKKILGEPEREFGFSYNLGLYRSGFDPTYLILEFDKQGKLKASRIQTI